LSNTCRKLIVSERLLNEKWSLENPGRYANERLH
jgi:hypothetical protein